MLLPPLATLYDDFLFCCVAAEKWRIELWPDFVVEPSNNRIISLS
jgi:hypothetical protein